MGVFNTNSMLANVYGRLSAAGPGLENILSDIRLSWNFLQMLTMTSKHRRKSLGSNELCLSLLLAPWKSGFTQLCIAGWLSLSLTKSAHSLRSFVLTACFARSTGLSALRAIEHYRGRVLNHGRACQRCDIELPGDKGKHGVNVDSEGRV